MSRLCSLVKDIFKISFFSVLKLYKVIFFINMIHISWSSPVNLNSSDNFECNQYNKKTKLAFAQDLTLTSLPCDILIQVFSYNYPDQTVKQGRTCKHFYNTINQEILWKNWAIKYLIDDSLNLDPNSSNLNLRSELTIEEIKKNVKRHSMQIKWALACALDKTEECSIIIKNHHLSIQYLDFIYPIKTIIENIIYEQDYQGYLKISPFMEILMIHKNPKAIQQVSSHLLYQHSIRDIKRSIALNDELYDYGYEPAQNIRIDGLNRGASGYEQNKDEAYRLNEELVIQGSESALHRKINLLCDRSDTLEAQALNDELITKGNKRAISRKICELSESGSIYPRDHIRLKSFVEEQILLNNRDALAFKERKLRYSTYDFQDRNDQTEVEANIQEAWKINQAFIDQGDEQAIQRKIHYLESNIHEDFCETLDCRCSDIITEINTFNEQLVKKNNTQAIIRKIEGYEDGSYGYKKNSHKAQELIENEILKGSKEAINCKIFGLMQGRYNYKKSIFELKNFIEELSAFNLLGIKLKIIGYLYGVCGFDLNKQKAANLINQYYCHPYINKIMEEN